MARQNCGMPQRETEARCPNGLSWHTPCSLPTGVLFLVGCHGGPLKLFHFMTCHLQRTVCNSACGMTCSFVPDGTTILNGRGRLPSTATGCNHATGLADCASDDNTMRQWAAATGRLQRILDQQPDSLFSRQKASFGLCSRWR
jgi:hypothetical protein